MAIYQLV